MASFFTNDFQGSRPFFFIPTELPMIDLYNIVLPGMLEGMLKGQRYVTQAIDFFPLS
jgi:hypothetical protein